MPIELIQILSSYYSPYLAKQAFCQQSNFSTATKPKITIQQYLDRLITYFHCSEECYLISLIYMKRLSETIDINSYNVHSLLLAAKFFDDSFYSNSYYARVGGITNKEMNFLELEFLKQIQFRLFISENEFSQCLQEVIGKVNENQQAETQNFQEN